MNRTIIYKLPVFLLAALLALPTAIAQSEAPPASAADTPADTTPAAEAEHLQTIRKLLAIKDALESRREQVRELLERLEAADEADKAELRKQLAETRATIAELSKSFEYFAVSGANLRLQTDEPDQELDWRRELEVIARPLLDSLKQATEKPRRIEELRRTIDLYEQQLEITRKATASIAQFEQYEMPSGIADGLDEVSSSWQQRGKDIERSLEISRNELHSLEVADSELFSTIGRAFQEFVLGRGLTLSIALFTALVLWYLMRRLRRLIATWRKPAQDTEHAARMRLILYAYHLLTILLVALSILSVFYARGDLLLLSLAIIALVMLALGAWRFLPGYIMEARLLLNVGAARQGERVIYNGLPFRIVSLNLYTDLRNPELEGSIRLPLSALAQLTSRARTDEAWFPSRVGDYLLLPDGSFGQVMQQTVEYVRLKVVGSQVQFATADFLNLNLRNLSQEGFGVVVGFGIDYQHQAIALDRVPARLRAAVESAFEQAGFKDDLKDLVVDFKEAATNSLDYLIYATLEGRSAASYFKFSRLIQQACVDMCNHEGWVIPFAQLTVHRADGEVPAANS